MAKIKFLAKNHFPLFLPKMTFFILCTLQWFLLISKIEFFIKADFRGLGFFISRPYAVFYIMKVVFFIKKSFEAKRVILPFFMSLTIGC